VARLVFDCEIGYSTARRAVAELVKAGLLERVRRGNRRRRQSDEYRLILAPDLLDRVDVPSPEEARRQIEKINAQVTGSGRERQRRISAHVDSAKPAGNIGSEDVDNPPEQDQQEVGLTLTIESGETRSNAHITPLLALATARPPIPKTPNRKRDQPSSLAGDHQKTPETKRTQDHPHQGALMAVLCGICPHCDTALDPDGTCLTCRRDPPKPAPPISAHPECDECHMLLDRDGTCPRCPVWTDMGPTIRKVTAAPGAGA
jgi:hypothetical protein